MGWTKTKYGVWGDTPQDLVNSYLDELLEKKVECGPLYFVKEKGEWRGKLRKDKKLRRIIDEVFVDSYQRPATSREFYHHIDVAVGLRQIEG